MKPNTRTVLQELNNISLSRDLDSILDSRGSNIIQSAINLLNLIRENYDEDTADLLEKRFMNSIKSSDVTKFRRGVARVRSQKPAQNQQLD